MRILIAPDKFKHSLGAREVADNIAAGLREVVPDATIEILPIADGGEGTAEVIRQARGGEWATCDSHDALGRAITARYATLPERATAVMEMSEASGLWRIAPHERDPFRANTRGVGEMLQAAAGQGAHEIIIGLGGSATNDGGFGLAQALGFRFLNKSGAELTGSVSDLLELDCISPPRDLALPRIIGAADVRNPLLGERGATRTFGPQKGATPDQVILLEEALALLADVVTRDLGCDFRDFAGVGAAGGLGFGLMSFCGATIQPGFDLVAEIVDLESAIRRADVVVTGEGFLDEQTLEGKAPAGVARLARRKGKRVYAIVGCMSQETSAVQLFDNVLPLATPSIGRDEAMSRTAELLGARARDLGRAL